MRGQVSDRDVLRAARVVLMREGARATTRQIAKQAGIAKGSLGARFGSKQALLRAAVVMGPPPWAEHLEAAIGVGDARDNLAGLLEAMIAWSRTVVPLALVACSATDPRDVDLGALRGERELARYLEEEMFLGRIDYVEPTLAARILAAAAWDAALTWPIGAPACTVAVLWRGLGPRPEEIELHSSNGPRPCWPPRVSEASPDVAPPATPPRVTPRTADPPTANPPTAEPPPANPPTAEPPPANPPTALPPTANPPGARASATGACAADLERTQRSATFCVPEGVERSLLGGDRQGVRWRRRRRRAWRWRARRARVAQRIDSARA